MSDKLKLEVLFAAVDKLTRPLKSITGGNKEAARALKATKDALKDLNREQSRLDAWRKMDKELSIVNNTMKGAQMRVTDLARAVAAAEQPSKQMTRALADAQRESQQLKARQNELLQSQQRLRTEFRAAGIDTKNLVNYQAELRSRLASTTATMNQQTAALQKTNAQARRMHELRGQRDRMMGRRNELAGGGTSTMLAGAVVGAPVFKAVRDYGQFEDAMLGVARQVEGARDDAGQLTPLYYDMGNAIKTMAERMPLATTEIAKIVEAGARMGIQGKENLLAYAETTAIMASAFDLPVELIGDQVGKLSGLYKIPIQSISELGDVINYLDDSAQSKGADIIDVMQRIAGVTTTANMTFRDSAALASTFLSLGSSAEVSATATNAIITNLSAATMQSKKFQDGLAMLKMNAKSIQLGMSKDATGTILKVLDAIKDLPQERQIEAATRLFGKEFGDDVSKLAGGIKEYRRQLELTRDIKAKGSMGKEADARNQNMSSVLQTTKNAIFDLSSDLGEQLKPAIVDVLNAIKGVAVGVRDWVRENPQLAGGIIKTVAAISLLITGVGAIMIAIAGVLGPFALFKFTVGALGTSMPVLAGGLMTVLGALTKVTLAFTAGYAAGTVLNGGINAWVSSMVGHEETLGGWFYDFIHEDIPRWSGELMSFLAALPARMKEIGVNMISGLISGMAANVGALLSYAGSIADGAINKVKGVLGIKSPSRVFAEIGGFTMEGMQRGIENSKGGPLDSMLSTARALAAAGAGVVMGGPALAGMPALDTRPPLSMAQPAGEAQAAQAITINIYPPAGVDAAEIGRMVRRELAAAQAQASARSRSQLADRD